MNRTCQPVLPAPSFEGSVAGPRVSRRRSDPVRRLPRSSFNFKLSTFDSISLTPFSSAPSALSQKVYFPQTLSDLCLAHSLAKHRGVGGISLGLQGLSTSALLRWLTRSLFRSSTFNVRRWTRVPQTVRPLEHRQLQSHHSLPNSFPSQRSAPPTAQPPSPPAFRKNMIPWDLTGGGLQRI